MEQPLSVYLRSVKQSSVYLADIIKAASHGLMIKSYANSKTEAKGDLQRLREETLTENQPARSLDGSPITKIRCCRLITCTP
jgi:hypothetical protein